MTKNKDFKTLVRARMSATGENYTSARSALITQELLEATAQQNSAHPEDPELDTALEAFRHKTRSAFMPGTTLLAIPTKRRALVVILLDLLATFDPDRVYTEPEVNDHLRRFHPDCARLRRELVDYGYLGRDPHTGRYWMNTALPDRRGNQAQEAKDLEAFLR
ncbi:DUF2087 domain-containing protein [Brevibacterium aurantiacum]|uniref:DUF2087 domain-containing protein n=1 Tax=Brevibacterium aurantiacum TaxID=273384 RepID=A0A4Z0KMX4_BREAU|nr:DUF2087 domain-containing protein [Brevibacterium aurantiacum]TGD39073.1 DUF2087 domain-containing protein [Brevibacterium aurantiacum]